MGKTFYEGLKYIRLDVDIYNNKKIDKLENRHGDAGFCFIIKLWCLVFSNSYYLKLDDDVISHFCRKVIFKSREEFDLYLSTCLEFNIFDIEQYRKYNILTSEEMQVRYMDITKRWSRVLFIPEYKCENVDLEPFNFIICNLKGHQIDKHHKVSIGKKPRKKKKTTAQKRIDLPDSQPETKIDIETGEITEYPVVPTPLKEIARICSIPYENHRPQFQALITEENFNKYKIFNQILDSDYPHLRQASNQMAAGEYQMLLTKPIDGKIPTKEELKAALIKLASSGVGATASIYRKMTDHIGYVRENKNKSQFLKDVPMLNGNYNFIDHSDMTKPKSNG